MCTVWRLLKQSFYLIAKTPPGDFQVTTTKTPLLSQQAVTSKGILSTLLTYSWTLIPIPNWTCSIVTVPLSDTRLPSTWLISCADPSTRLQTPTKEVVGYKVLQFIHIMKIKKMLGHKTLWCKYTATSSRERDELGQELRLRSKFAWTEFAQSLCNLCIIWRPLKKSFYMSRVKRKEGPKIGDVEQLSSSCRVLMNLHYLLDFLNWLEGFNT